MAENFDYEYYAFISYRHRTEDRAFAEWLLDSLETFQTPDRIVREGYPDRFGKVFRDDDELRAEAELTPAIKRALYASRYLIVVCSPATPASPWVRSEIRLFQHWGRGDRIIPVLIDGTPEQSFPPELMTTVVSGEGPDAEFRTEMPRGPKLLPEQGKTEDELKERALFTIAATMLGCTYGQLRDRVEERVRKQTVVELFEQVEWRRGSPVGIGALDDATAAGRSVSWRFESRGGKVSHLLRVNGHGKPAPDDDGISRIDIHYREDGGVERLIHRDRHDVVRKIERYNADQSIVDFTHEDDSASPAGAFGSGLGQALNIFEKNRKSTVLRHLLEYNESGFVIRRRYCRDTFNTTGRDALGSFGQAFERNERGQATRTWSIDADGVPMPQRNGIAFQISIYDPEGREAEWAYFDFDGVPVPHKNGYARVTLAYDDRGNLIEEAYFGIDGAPILHKDSYARLSRAYDTRGNLIEEAYFGTDGAPILHKNGYARSTFAYDDRGNLIEYAYFGTDGAPILHKNGYARSTFAYDDRGNLIEEAYFGTDGAPILEKDGFARISVAYDARGSIIELAYFGADGAPALIKNGLARTSITYDARGNIIEYAFFGTDGAPALIQNGFARISITYDARGNTIEYAYFGTDGAPILSKNGYARINVAYDDRGNTIEYACFGPEGSPVLNKYGYARGTFAYDDRGNLIEEAYFGLDGAPVLNKDGCARVTLAYDDRGNLIEEAYFGLDGAPILHKNGYARSTFAYDDRGNLIEYAYFGTDGAPILDNDGIARLTYTYDARGNTIEYAYFGTDGAPILHKNGYARINVTYDDRGNAIEYACFGPEGSLVLDKNGFARVTLAYDDRGNRIKAEYFGPDGALNLRRAIWQENESFNGLFGDWQALILRSLFSEQELDGRFREGFARVERQLDARGHEIERLYTNPDGNPANGPEGFAQIWIEVDALGNPLLVIPEFADRTRPLHLRFSYSERYDVERVDFVDAAGKPATSNLGVASVVFLYDDRNQRTGVQYLDHTGAAMETG